MTKEDFIHEAAIRMAVSNPDADVLSIAERARDLANHLFGNKEEEEREVTTVSHNNDPIEYLIREIDRIDDEGIREKKENAIANGHNWVFAKRGYAERIKWACNDLDVVYVGDLISLGRRNFIKARNIGKTCCSIIDTALNNLYNIKSW